jgi:hypothetical protein
MVEAEVERAWNQFKSAVRQKIGSRSFHADVALDDFSLIYQVSNEGLHSAKVLNCSLNPSSKKIVCKRFEITNTLKEFRPRVEIKLTSDSEALLTQVLDLYKDFAKSG